MNGKRAKQLRRAARESTKGLPATSYRLDDRSTKEYTVMDEKEGLVKRKFARTISLGPSVRHFYHLLKLQYRLWQVSGEVKARHRRAVDSGRTLYMKRKELSYATQS